MYGRFFPPVREREHLKTPTVLVLEHLCWATRELRRPSCDDFQDHKH